MKKQPNASVPGGNGWPAQQEHGSEQDEDPLAARRPLAASRESESTDRDHPPTVPTMLSTNGGPTAGQLLTTSKTPSCCTAERSRALRIASPVPIPATAS